MSDVRIIVAGNSPLLRAGIVQVLTRAGIHVVAQAISADDLLSQDRIYRSDIIVMDIGIPPACTDGGLRAALMLRDENPAIGVLFLSQRLETVCARELFKVGASGIGYLLRDRVDNIDRFVESVRQVGNGGLVLDSDVVALLVSRQHSNGVAASNGHGNAFICRNRTVTDLNTRSRPAEVTSSG